MREERKSVAVMPRRKKRGSDREREGDIQGGPKRMETFVSFTIAKPFMGFAYY